ncbi:hypothetical protein A6X21_08045 [Planctopirus hydrillae]|uniref:Uncharacterized protein n=1 Tax=Planctopirus hydrillae TaxID=1841610 RepID=A0A1C3E8Q7_9PLAN|nr:hypothetical protein A6X21_08045 [Planctopirus hydrillae]
MFSPESCPKESPLLAPVFPKLPRFWLWWLYTGMFWESIRRKVGSGQLVSFYEKTAQSVHLKDFFSYMPAHECKMKQTREVGRNSASDSCIVRK